MDDFVEFDNSLLSEWWLQEDLFYLILKICNIFVCIINMFFKSIWSLSILY